MCEKQVQRTDSNRNSDSSCSGWTLLIWYQHVVQRVVGRERYWGAAAMSESHVEIWEPPYWIAT